MENKDLVTSVRDKNKYEFIELTNGLQALIIQDISDQKEEVEESDSGSQEEGGSAEEDKQDQNEEEGSSRLAAVALSVSAGCFHEQKSCNGIAHFLEHMCFMGSEKYPNENEFDNLLTKYGGYNNAFTDIMNTNYQFSVGAKHLKKMLDIFAHFFIDPLLKPDAVNREIEAIQNQFQTSLTSQAHRFHELFMYFVQTPQVKGRFLMGSSQSILGPRPTPQAKAQECEGFQKGMEYLKSYFSKNYDPRAMRLVVSSSAPIEETKASVIESFSSIPKREYPIFQWKSKVPFITSQSAQEMMLFESTKTDTILYLTWGFPCSGVEYRGKSTSYLANLIGHEAKGSLLYLLKKRQYASTLSTYTQESVNVVSHLLFTQIKLTENGLENLSEVMNLIFSYIAWLQQLPSLPAYFFEEVKQMRDIKFRFLQKEDPFDQVTDLAQKWTFLEKSDRHLLLREKENCYSQLDLADIKNYLNQMEFKNTKTCLSIPKLFQKTAILERDPDRKTQFHPFYKLQVVQASRDLILQTPIKIDQTIAEQIGASLPTPNVYIPTDFQSVNLEYDKLEEKYVPKSLDLTPQKIFENESLRLYYSLDKTFKMPSSVFTFKITLDEPRETAKDNALFYLFVKYLEESFNIEHGYYGYLAKAEYQIDIAKERCINFRVQGYMHNLDKFVLHFFDTLSKLLKGDSIDMDLLKVEREQMLKKKKNTLMSGTYLADKVRLDLHQNRKAWLEVLLAQIQHASDQEFVDYVKSKLSKSAIHVIAYYYGCLGEEAAKNQIDQVLTPLKSFVPIPQTRWNELNEQMSGILAGKPEDIREVALINRNPESTLSTCIVNFSLPHKLPSNQLTSRLTITLLNHLMSERCYNVLRTKEALGYTVYSTSWRTRKIVGVEIIVQSAKYDPDYLQGRIKAFLEQFIEDLEKKEEEMKEDMQGLVEQLDVPFNKVTELTQSVWSEISQESTLYNIKREMLKRLDSLEYSEFIQLAKQVLLKTDKPSELNVQVIKVYEVKKVKDKQIEQTPIHEQLDQIRANYVLI